MRELTVDREFNSLIPQLKDDELTTLKTSIEEEGVREPLIVWAGYDIILDGHNRYRIATELDIDYKITERAFNTREECMVWMIKNQFGRRNLSSYDRSILALKLEPLIREKAKERMLSGKPVDPTQKSAGGETRDELAKAAGVSHDTIMKVKKIEDSDNEEVKKQVREGKTSINKAYHEIKKPKHEEVETEEVEIIIEDEDEDIKPPTPGEVYAEKVINMIKHQSMELPSLTDVRTAISLIKEKLTEWDDQLKTNV